MSQALTGAAPGAPNESSTPAAPAAAPDATAQPLAIQSGDFTPAQLQTMADDLVKRGRLTREQADEMLRADGAALPEPEQGLSPEAAAIDRAFPPARPQDYQMPEYSRPGEGLTPEESKFDAMARGWLADARFTREIGSSLAREIAREAQAHEAKTESQRELYRRSTEALLQRMWGDQYDERVSLARTLVRELDARKPGLLAVLEHSGAGNNPRVIAALASQAERLLMRRAK
jgi:hypothetical protein